jgi:hypothetical protein
LRNQSLFLLCKGDLQRTLRRPSTTNSIALQAMLSRFLQVAKIYVMVAGDIVIIAAGR